MIMTAELAREASKEFNDAQYNLFLNSDDFNDIVPKVSQLIEEASAKGLPSISVSVRPEYGVPLARYLSTNLGFYAYPITKNSNSHIQIEW